MIIMKHWLQLGGLSREHLVSVCILSDVMSNSPSSNVNCGLVVQFNDVRAKIVVLLCHYIIFIVLWVLISLSVDLWDVCLRRQ